MTVNDLKNGSGFVTFIFKDRTAFTFPTTLNKDVLEVLGAGEPNGNQLYNIDKNYWIDIPQDAELLITELMPDTGEVNKFVTSFF